MAEEYGEELEENYQIEEIEKIIFVANENSKNQSHPACQPIQPVDKTLWVSFKTHSEMLLTRIDGPGSLSVPRYRLD